MADSASKQSWNWRRLVAVAGMLAAAYPAAADEALQSVISHAKYAPIQSISYEFGSKFMSGYFVEEASTCFIALMIVDKPDPEDVLPVTATRVRLMLQPGQIAGLDSEEGRSLNLACAEDAKAVLVDFGDREKLMALQALAVPDELATSSPVK